MAQPQTPITDTNPEVLLAEQEAPLGPRYTNRWAFDGRFNRPKDMRVPEGLEEELGEAFLVAYEVMTQSYGETLAEPRPATPEPSRAMVWASQHTLGRWSLGLAEWARIKRPAVEDPAVTSWRARRSDAANEARALSFLRDKINGFEYSAAVKGDDNQLLNFNLGYGSGSEIAVWVRTKPGAGKCVIETRPHFWAGVDGFVQPYIYEDIKKYGADAATVFRVMGKWVSRALTVGHDESYMPESVSTSRAAETYGGVFQGANAR